MSEVQPFTKLKIRNCNITEIGGMVIAKSLAYDRGLCTLKIDNNPLNMEVAIALHTVMKTNFNITDLSTLNCNFSYKMTNFLRSVAYYNRYIKRSELNYIDLFELKDEAKDIIKDIKYNSFFEEELSIEPEFEEEIEQEIEGEIEGGIEGEIEEKMENEYP